MGGDQQNQRDKEEKEISKNSPTPFKLYDAQGRELVVERSIGEGASATVWQGYYSGRVDPAHSKATRSQRVEGISSSNNKGGWQPYSRDQRISQLMRAATPIPVAIKQLKRLTSLDFGKFQQEAGVLQSLAVATHGGKALSNLVEFFDFFYYERAAHTSAATSSPSLEKELNWYLVLEYCRWPALEEVQSELSQDVALDYLTQIAEGLASLHRLGIYHRDLKPGNILIGEGTDRQPVAKITDFGQAFVPPHLGGLGIHTHGSLWYAAPELLTDPTTADHRADIYSWGVMAYLLLTRRPYLPFSGDREHDRALILGQNHNPAYPLPPQYITGLKKPISHRLSQAVLKALAFNPQERYQTASELAETLKEVFSSTPSPKAVPTPGAQTATGPSDLWIKGQLIQLPPLQYQVRQPFRQKFDGIGQIVFSPDGEYLLIGCDNIITVLKRSGPVPQGFTEAGSPQPAPPYIVTLGATANVQAQAHYLSATPGYTFYRALKGIHPLSGISGLDRKPLVSTTTTTNPTSAPNTHIGTEEGTGQEQEGWLVAACSINTIKTWDLHSGQILHDLKHDTGLNPVKHVLWVDDVKFSPDGKTLWSCSMDKTIRAWDAATGQFQFRLTGHTDAVNHLATSPDGKTLASCSWDKTVRLWDITSRKLAKTLPAHTDMALFVKFSPDGHYLLSGGSDKALKLWEPASGRLVRSFEGHDGSVLAGDFTPDGKLVASGCSDMLVRIYRLDTGELLHTLAGYAGKVGAVTFSPDGKWLVTGSYNGEMRWWSSQF